MTGQHSLTEHITELTTPYRKGFGMTVNGRPVGAGHAFAQATIADAAKVAKDEGLEGVVEIWGYPPIPPDKVTIDVHFFHVGIAPHAKQHRDDVVSAIKAEYPDLDRLRHGPSYIEVGATLGSQELALRLFALGEALSLWRVITPKTMGLDGPDADDFAGRGFVMISGFSA